jgi:hypothetical protein
MSQAIANRARITSLGEISVEIHQYIAEVLVEFQASTKAGPASEWVGAVDTLVGGSFLNMSEDNPDDIDILVATDAPPSQGVKDGFWKYINEKQISLTHFGYSDESVELDCCGVVEVDAVDEATAKPRQYSLRLGEHVPIEMYADIAQLMQEHEVHR